MISVAIDMLIGEMALRFGSISARHMGHVLIVCSDFNKHDVQNLWPQAVMVTFVDLTCSKHTAHTSAFDMCSDALVVFHRYCILCLAGLQ
jgi:hypothetical protein